MRSPRNNQRLPAVSENNRKYQDTVSAKLADQVLAALVELMRGLLAANDASKGELLREVSSNKPNHVYSGLVTVLMRLVVLLYAEDRDLLSSDPVESNFSSVTGLFNRLRQDAGRFPDTMDQRFGSWSQLNKLFRLFYEGGPPGEFKSPPHRGFLFEPNRYSFLEGRHTSTVTGSSPIASDQRLMTTDEPPIPDGVVYRVLRNLLILGGERLNYRKLDVELIGSIYESVMGFDLEVAPSGAIALQPSAERRRSGSHYTPRSLTEPIVRTTLEPVLQRLVTGHLSLVTCPASSAKDKGQMAMDARRQTKRVLAELERRETRS